MLRRPLGVMANGEPSSFVGMWFLMWGCLVAMSLTTEWPQVAAQDGTIPARLAPADDKPADAGDVANALRPAGPKKIPRDPLELLVALGPFAYPLGLTSIIVVWFSIERLVVLRRGRVIPRPFLKRFFEHLDEGKLDPKSAIKLCEDNHCPIASVLAHGLRKWGKSSVEIEQAIIDGGERQVGQLRKHLRALNGAATIAPLLGLLGTVVGMIDAFNTIATKNAMGKSEELSAGIGLALLTTAAGLIIAIPALIMYSYLGAKVDDLVIEMDEISQSLVSRISSEGLAEAARAPKPAASSKTTATTDTRKAV